MVACLERGANDLCVVQQMNQIRSNANLYCAVYRKRIRGAWAGTRPDRLC